MREIQGFATERDIPRVIDGCPLDPDERTALRRRVARPCDAADAPGFILEEHSAVLHAGHTVTDIPAEGYRTLIIQAHIEVHPGEHASAWSGRYVGYHHRAECLGPGRPAVNPAVERRAEIEGFQRKSEGEIAGFVQTNMAQFAHRERAAPGSALAGAHDCLNGPAIGQE